MEPAIAALAVVLLHLAAGAGTSAKLSVAVTDSRRSLDHVMPGSCEVAMFQKNGCLAWSGVVRQSVWHLVLCQLVCIVKFSTGKIKARLFWLQRVVVERSNLPDD